MRIPGLALFLMLSGCAATSPPPAAAPSPPPNAVPPAAAVPAPSPAVATVDGVAITAAQLDAHVAATKLARPEAVDDLIDLTLLRAACAAQGIALAPGEPSAEVRAAAELELAHKVGIEVPPGVETLVVDHAWIKDGAKKAQTAKQKKAIEELRVRVVAGQALPEAFKTLPGVVDAASWHIGDHEEYPYDVVPAAAHDLAAGSVSPVVPGDGGLHLFKIHARKPPPAPGAAVHRVLRGTLRDGKTIELVEPAAR